MNYPEEEVDIEAEVVHATGEGSGGYTKYFQEAVDEGETNVGEVVWRVINRRQ